MAKRYHLTDNGPQRCRTRRRKCTLKHYSTKDEVIAALQFKEEVRNNDARIRALAKEIDTLPDGRKKHIYGNFNVRTMDHARRVGNEIEQHYLDNNNERPEFVGGSFSVDLNNPGLYQYRFSARKTHQISGYPAKIISTWLLRLQRQDGVVETAECPLTTTGDGLQLKREAYRLVGEATEKGWPTRKQFANEKRRQILDSFTNIVTSIEAEERGAQAASEIGFSFFEFDGVSEISARADFSETTFRARSVEDALKDESYDYWTPNVAVILQDSQAKTADNYWTLEGANDSWAIHKTLANGNNETVGPFSDPQVAYDTITEFTRKHMVMPKARSESCGNTAASIVASVPGFRRNHASEVERRIAAQKANRTFRPPAGDPARQHSEHREFYTPHTLIINEINPELELDNKELSMEEEIVVRDLEHIEEKIQRHKRNIDRGIPLVELQEWHEVELGVEFYGLDPEKHARAWDRQDYDEIRLMYARALSRQNNVNQEIRLPPEQLIARAGGHDT